MLCSILLGTGLEFAVLELHSWWMMLSIPPAGRCPNLDQFLKLFKGLPIYSSLRDLNFWGFWILKLFHCHRMTGVCLVSHCMKNCTQSRLWVPEPGVLGQAGRSCARDRLAGLQIFKFSPICVSDPALVCWGRDWVMAASLGHVPLKDPLCEMIHEKTLLFWRGEDQEVLWQLSLVKKLIFAAFRFQKVRGHDKIFHCELVCNLKLCVLYLGRKVFAVLPGCSSKSLIFRNKPKFLGNANNHKC